MPPFAPLAALVLLSAVCCPLSGARADTVPLDRFLPFEDDCRETPLFSRWAASLSEGVAKLVLARDPQTPVAFAGIFGPAQVLPAPSADSLGIVEVPVAGGTYRGLPVAAIRIVEPNGVPRTDYAVRFSASPEAVRAALAPLLAAQAALYEPIGVMTVSDGPEGPTLRCVVDF